MKAIEFVPTSEDVIIPTTLFNIGKEIIQTIPTSEAIKGTPYFIGFDADEVQNFEVFYGLEGTETEYSSGSVRTTVNIGSKTYFLVRNPFNTGDIIGSYKILRGRELALQRSIEILTAITNKFNFVNTDAMRRLVPQITVVEQEADSYIPTDLLTSRNWEILNNIDVPIVLPAGTLPALTTNHSLEKLLLGLNSFGSGRNNSHTIVQITVKGVAKTLLRTNNGHIELLSDIPASTRQQITTEFCQTNNE